MWHMFLIVDPGRRQAKLMLLQKKSILLGSYIRYGRSAGRDDRMWANLANACCAGFPTRYRSIVHCFKFDQVHNPFTTTVECK
jgi:hypothetical protein